MLHFSAGRLFSLALLFVQILWNAAILHGANFFGGGGTINAQNRKGPGNAQAQSVSVSFSHWPESSQVGMQNGARPMLTLPALLRIVCKFPSSVFTWRRENAIRPNYEELSSQFHSSKMLPFYILK